MVQRFCRQVTKRFIVSVLVVEFKEVVDFNTLKICIWAGRVQGPVRVRSHTHTPTAIQLVSLCWQLSEELLSAPMNLSKSMASGSRPPRQPALQNRPSLPTFGCPDLLGSLSGIARDNTMQSLRACHLLTCVQLDSQVK
eukprot:4327730-Amphidinium_carterae.1